MSIDKELLAISGKLGNSKAVKTTPRKLLALFGAHRRGANVVESIRTRLSRFGLGTEPDFSTTPIDDSIRYELAAEKPHHIAQLELADERLKSGEPAHQVTVRELLMWFGAERRGSTVSERIDAALNGFDLTTEPDFRTTHVDAYVKLSRRNQHDLDPASAGETQQPEAQPSESHPSRDDCNDSTFLVGTLAEANRTDLVTVKPQVTLRYVSTVMLSHRVSHVPVMRNDRDVVGIVSWKDLAKHFALRDGTLEHPVEAAMSPAVVVPATEPFLAVIPKIIDHGHVLVRDTARRISGIVTKKDLGRRLKDLAYPFVLLGEIERAIRGLVDAGDFTPDELRELGLDPSSPRDVQSISDLTLGEYQRLLDNDTAWSRIGLTLDRKPFIERFNEVRVVRNNVMHFDPESPTPRDSVTLQGFCDLLRELRPLGREDA